MADLAYRNEAYVARNRTDWGAIWAGMFTFIAIWSVFGSLGLAIFVSNANANAGAPVAGQNWGLGAWVIVLTTISLYVAGRETGRLAGVTNRQDGLIHGMIMFGLSVAAAIVLVSLGGAVLSGGTGVNGGVHSPYMLNVVSELGWMGFVALILGWLGAMWGASTSVAHKSTTANVRDIRPAA